MNKKIIAGITTGLVLTSGVGGMIAMDKKNDNVSDIHTSITSNSLDLSEDINKNISENQKVLNTLLNEEKRINTHFMSC